VVLPTATAVPAAATPVPVVLPTATSVSTPVPLPTATAVSTPVPTATATPQPVKIQFRAGTVPIAISGKNFELKGFRVENVKELRASGGVSASVFWGDKHGFKGVSIDVKTGAIYARHTYQSGGTFPALLRIKSESGDSYEHEFSVYVEGEVEATAVPVPTPMPTPTVTPTPTATPLRRSHLLQHRQLLRYQRHGLHLGRLQFHSKIQMVRKLCFNQGEVV